MGVVENGAPDPREGWAAAGIYTVLVLYVAAGVASAAFQALVHFA